MADNTAADQRPTEPPPQPQQEDDRRAQPVDAEPPPRLPFPVIGIGASAGGLEAVSELISALPADTGMAFVFIQHLPPEHKSLIAEILSKRTAMPVRQVEDGMAIQPDHVYVIRPGHTMTIEDGVLRLRASVDQPGHSRPIDDFFRSLAAEQHERAICIVMSGMGSNGSAGAQAVKAVGGLCVAQDPESAEFTPMPRHLIDTGYADYVLRPREMPDVLLSYAVHPYVRGQREKGAELAKRDQQHLREILAVLRTRTRQDFNGYRKPTVLRRIQRRMGLNRVTKLGDYAKLLRQNPTEMGALADDLLIHVTGFFRDPEAWEVLRQQVIVPLIASRGDNESVRSWAAACASGEEAYTLAMLLVEEAERVGKRLDIKVFATDTAERSLQNARTGSFPGGIESEVNAQRLERFFVQEDAVYRVRQELRELVVFAPQNLLHDPPFSRLDVITCRNLLIYLEPDVQQRILKVLHFGLREGGALFLGTSETAGTDDLFEPIDKKARIYRRVGPTRHGTIEFPLPATLQVAARAEGAPAEGGALAGRPALAQRTARALLEHHTPAAVTIDRDSRIVFFHGDTEPFIASPRGEPTRDLLQLVREQIRGAVRTVVQRAASGETVATALGGWLETRPGHVAQIAVTASALDGKHAPEHLVVSFQERGELPRGKQAAADRDREPAADELLRVRDELRSTIEELQASNEELKASHEEVVSTNEELQSSNEELETSREEMQSLNEELSTVNNQLHAKIEEHQAAHSDLASLLASTDMAVLFLDTRFRIRRYTPQVRELLDLLETDIGRPLSDLARKFTDPDLVADAQAVLMTLLPREREVAGERGRHYLRRVTPYRTGDNRIDGVVVTFVDISARLRTEEALRASEEQFRRAIEDAPIPVILQAEGGEVYQINRAWTEATGTTLKDVPTLDAWLSLVQGDGAAALRRQLHELFTGDRRSLEVELAIRTKGGAGRQWSLSASAPGTLQDGRRFIVGMAVDITARHQAESALRESEERLRLLVEGVPEFAMLMLDPAGLITAWNEGAERLLGYSGAEAVGHEAAMLFTPEDRQAGVPGGELAQAVGTGRAKDERWHIRKDGSRFWGSGVLAALRHQDGSLRGFVMVMRDDTLRRQAEEATRVSSEAALAANRMKDEFLASLSHELRTPLNAILLWAKLLQGTAAAATEPQVGEGLAAITRGAEAQKALIEDLLDVSRISSGNLRLQVREIELAGVVHEAIESIEPTADAKQLTVNADLGQDVGVVRADPDRLRQIVWNLLTNAVKFTPQGGRIEVALRRLKEEVEISVADTGAGIKSDFLPDVFDRFRQGDASKARVHGGVGLGLAIAKQLTELHGGTIGARSPGPNQGATFVVRLPLPRVTVYAPSQVAAGAPAAGEEDSAILSGLTLLLVEDDVETRQALVLLLGRAGLNVIEAGTAAAALESFDTSPPDLILSDISLPGEDGYALIRRIRAREAQSGAVPVPAVALTAYAGETDRRMALEAGYQQHLGKPIGPDDLLVELRALRELTRRD
ncbi:MAG TPA: chemotaxis protein CheB [Thermoanaerobaculia bacterium]|jgi:two-component system CheB/CheR fusion protein|nr:chemotaxis protein CheB [Thermoanaerobaculia bacterium]